LNIPLLNKNSLIFALVIAFIFGGIAHADQSRYGGTLIFGSMGEPLSLDPGVILDSESSQVANTSPCLLQAGMFHQTKKHTHSFSAKM
jgi:hypothetical protein